MYPFSKSDKKKKEQVLNQSNREEKPIKRNLPEGVWFSGDLQSRPLHCKSSSCHKGDLLWSGLGHEEWHTLTNWSSGFHTFQLKRKDEKDEKVGKLRPCQLWRHRGRQRRPGMLVIHFLLWWPLEVSLISETGQSEIRFLVRSLRH